MARPLPAARVLRSGSGIARGHRPDPRGFFSRGDTEPFRPLVEPLLHYDPYVVLADFQSCCDCQQFVSDRCADGDRWTRMSIVNFARSALFSSDRTIREYCRDVWRVSPVPIRLVSQGEVEVDFMQ